ncbi:integrin alpha-X-like [Corticium candelabrum]|uniref:integrin alpha-X-like n=1 Tax=Corticium candelabrum TaxID=121492 RepID=UPI002E31C10E|nr:integrin alpha-X-like [Corticium candelabrum]
MQLRGSCCCDEPSLYKDNKAARKSLLVDGLISSSRSLSVKMMTLRVQILSLVSVFFVLQTNPSYAVPINVDEDFLKPLCENPPPVLRLVCKSLFGVTCPTQAKLGDWAYNGREVDGSLNSTAASACPGVRLQTYERTTNLSTILSECRSKVIVQTEEEYRCPPTTKEKAAALTRIFGSFGPPPPPVVQPSAAAATVEPTTALPVRAKRQECYYNDAIDLAILIDASGSVGSPNFYKSVEDVATLIENTCNDFKCGSPQIRVAVVTFASSPVTVFDLAYSAANHHNRQDIIDSILTTHYTNGGTATRSALEHVRDNIFSASHGMRRHSKKKLMVLTDGNHNGGQDPKDVAESLHERPGSDQVDVFALGIGSGISFQNVKNLNHASDLNKILPFLTYSSFAEFSQGVQVVAADAQANTNSCSSSAFKK